MKNVYYTDEVIGSVLAYMLNYTQLGNFLNDNREAYKEELFIFLSITSDSRIDEESAREKNLQFKELFERIHAKRIVSNLMAKRNK